MCKTMQVTRESRKSRATVYISARRGTPPSTVLSWSVAGMATCGFMFMLLGVF